LGSPVTEDFRQQKARNVLRAPGCQNLVVEN
jgi:hypothetical protein